VASVIHPPSSLRRPETTRKGWLQGLKARDPSVRKGMKARLKARDEGIRLQRRHKDDGNG
jgi:hypothetical protein